MINEAHDNVAPPTGAVDIACKRAYAFERSGLEQRPVGDILVGEALAHRPIGGRDCERGYKISPELARVRRDKKLCKALRGNALPTRQSRTIVQDEFRKTQLLMQQPAAH